MNKFFSLLLLLLVCYNCQQIEEFKKTYLIETTMTKEELLALLNTNQEDIAVNEPDQPNSIEGETKTSLKKNHSSVEKEETQTPLKNHHSSVVEVENNAQTTALIKQYKNTQKKASLFQYVVAFLIVVILLNLYFYGSQRRKLVKHLDINRFDSINYSLLNNHSC